MSELQHRATPPFLYDIVSGRERLVLRGHQAAVRGASLKPGRLAARGHDVYVMTVDVDELLEIARSRVTRDLTDEECQTYLHVDACPSD